MKKLLSFLVLGSCLLAGAAQAQSCEAKAVDKNGKALVGAAKTSSISKCEKDAKAAAAATCAAKAMDKNGKPLTGAAKTSSITKCEKDATKG